MSKIIQICPVPTNVRLARYNPDEPLYIEGLHPMCLALVARGDKTEVAYIEAVDNELVPVDPDDPDFLGPYNTVSGIPEDFKKMAQQKYNKENNVKSE